MKRFVIIALLFVAFSANGQESVCDSISANGLRLMKLLDATRVEELWQKGFRVNWETGETIAVSNNPRSTHCSAFAASFSKQMGIYLLRPPEHKQTLLANAQYDWLQSENAKKEGWILVKSALEAQNLANKGYLVVTVYKNEDASRPGHIAIIRPAVKKLSLLQKEGPQVTQSGGTNAFSISLKRGFGNHPDAWPDGVLFFEHELDWKFIKD